MQIGRGRSMMLLEGGVDRVVRRELLLSYVLYLGIVLMSR